jgi:glucokinase
MQHERFMILAGDVGGTKVNLAVFREKGGELEPVRIETFASHEFGSLEEIVSRFLGPEAAGAIGSACFGVAGAIVDGRAHLTNLLWQVEQKILAGVLKSEVFLLNDMQASAYGMLYLKEAERFVVNAGMEPAPRGNAAVIAAGTGLGESCLFWDGVRYHPMASEGGHVDFSPRNDMEIALWSYLRAKFSGHVSWERVLSGPGLFNLYSFLRDRGYYPEPPELGQKLAKASDPNPLIAQAGVARTNPLCAATVDLFIDLYAAEAGNLALKCLAVGGVYLAGGIAPKILPAFQAGKTRFVQSFAAKGRFQRLLQTIPVFVSLNAKAPLWGAAYYAWAGRRGAGSGTRAG